MTAINPYFDPILGKLRNSDIGLISLASITDPFIVNNLGVLSTGSINNLYANTILASSASIGNLTTNNIANTSNASFGTIYTNSLFASTATLGYTHISTIDWNLTSGATVTQEGQMNWDANQQTAVIGMAGGNVDLALGMEQLFPRRVRNSTGSTMAKGTVVYINGVSGNTPTVERAIATSDMTSAFTLGMTAETIGNGATGWVATFGELTGLDLSAYTGGDTLYLSGATAGAFTNVPQLAPKHYVRVGTVVKATTDGALVVNVINGYELNELHNVAITSLASGQILQSGVSNLWYNVTPAFIPTTSYPSLGSLAVLNTYNFYNLVSYPSLGSLAGLNQTNFYNLISYPSLGSLSQLNSLSYYALDSRLSLGSLAVQNNLSYYALDSRLSLGSLAVQNNINFYNLISYPSLGSLAPLNAITQGYLPSTASFDAIFTNNIANNSTISTNLLYANSILASTMSLGILFARGGSFLSAVSVNTLNAKGNITGANLSGTNTGDQVLPIYGDGIDGVIVFDGNNTYAFATYTISTSTYTLTRDIWASQVYVTNGILVRTNGYRLFANDFIQNNGIIHNDGYDSTGISGAAGGGGNYFASGIGGGSGIATASAGVGLSPSVPTAGTFVGGVGGKGGPGRSSTTATGGGVIPSTSISPPSNAKGGTKVTSNIISYMQSYIVGSTNWQMSPSIGGGGGSKSAAGTNATSGGGGGGGGICFVATPNLTGVGSIRSQGGRGGDAVGTGGNFGGGGGGGGGIVCVVTRGTTNNTFYADGGSGGYSINGTNNNLGIALADGTYQQSNSDTFSLTPTNALSKNNLYLLTMLSQQTAGTGTGITSVSGYNLTWQSLPSSRIYFSTIASPTRVQETWYGYWDYTKAEPDIADDDTITITLSANNTNTRFILDEIENVDNTTAITTNLATNRLDSTATLSVTLPSAPVANNLVYSVFTRTGGTTSFVGTGNTLVNNQTTAPIVVSEVSNAQRTNALSTATVLTAAAGMSLEISKAYAGYDGTPGWAGKVIRLYG